MHTLQWFVQLARFGWVRTESSGDVGVGLGQAGPSLVFAHVARSWGLNLVGGLVGRVHSPYPIDHKA